jgi:hypothetical protein
MKKTKRRLFVKSLVVTVCIIAVSWLILTLWVERQGPAKTWHVSNETATKKVLVVFDPDPIYNLDEQVCLSLGKGLAQGEMDVTIETVAAVNPAKLQAFDAYVFCANTYNWAPDWAIANFIQSKNFLKSKPAIAITVGSGTTRQAQRALEQIIVDRGATLVASNTWWLMRPNDEEHPEADNVDVAVSQAYKIGMEVSGELKK